MKRVTLWSLLMMTIWLPGASAAITKVRGDCFRLTKSPQTGCPIFSGADPGTVPPLATMGDDAAEGGLGVDCYFFDPLPTGSVALSVRPMLWGGTAPNGAHGPELSFMMNALVQFGSVTVTTPPFQCNESTLPWSVAAEPVRFNYHYTDDIFAGRNTVMVSVNDGELLWDQLEFEIEYRPRYEVRFDLSSETKILLHRYRSDDAGYPSAAQRADHSIEISGVVLDEAGAPVPDLPVYLRVLDPSDSAPYAASDARINDNADLALPLGRLLPSGSTATNASGRFAVTLETTEQYAGDNYQVQLDFEPSFSCRGGCDTSPTLTTWKRVYLEYDEMFQAGTYLRQPVPAGATIIPVLDADVFGRNDTITFMHGPRLNNSSLAQPYYSETARVTAIDRRGNAITIDPPLRNPYDGPETIANDPRAYLADAIGIGSETFELNRDLIAPAYAPAFVEYVLVSDPLPYVPFEETLVHCAPGSVDCEQVFISEKWFAHRTRPNHQHLLSGTREATTENFGRAGRWAAGNMSWVFVPMIESFFPNRRERDAIGEVVIHELAHQWRVDPPNFHCTTDRAWNDATRWCTMHHRYQDCQLRRNGPLEICPEFSDGRIAFHYTRTAFGPSSEYLDIRRQLEPVPQF